MSTFELNVLSQAKKHFSGDVNAVFVPTVGGELKILPHHTSLIAKLKPGYIRMIIGSQEESIDVKGGFLNVGKKKTSIVVF